MGKYDYLDEERKKMWAVIEDIKGQVKKYTPEEVVALRAQIETAKEASITAEANSARYDALLKQAETTTESINASASEIKVKAQEVASNSEATSQHLISIQESVSQASSSVAEAQQLDAQIESVKTNLAAKEKQLDKVDTIHSNISEFEQKVGILHKNILGKERAVTELHREIFGYIVESEDNDKPERVEGLKDHLNSSYNALEEGLSSALNELKSIKDNAENNAEFLSETWRSKHEDLNEEIQKLLPKALTAGLAAAYSDKKDEEIEDQKRLQKIFNKAIIGLVIVSLLPFCIAIHYIMGAEYSLEQVIDRLPKLAAGILPIYIPVLWVAYSANKKLSLSKRLIEEYAHKEVLSRTYEGLSRQIENIDSNDIASELRVKLLYNVLEISAENPGKLITDYDKSDHPIIEALDRSSKLSDSIDKLSRIPGFAKLADRLAREAEKTLAEENRKANQGIAANEAVSSDKSKEV